MGDEKGKCLWFLGFSRNIFWVSLLIGFFFSEWVSGFEGLNVSEVSLASYGASSNPLMVGLTLIQGAAAKGAVCLDATLPGYHLHSGYGAGANSWLIQLEGGGWCNDIRTCVYRRGTHRGSSALMEKEIPFTGILSNKPYENPDFYNWNRVKFRYCDGASFSGEGQNEAESRKDHRVAFVFGDDISIFSNLRKLDLGSSLHCVGMAANLLFRGQRIWLTGMEDLMSKGMSYASQALLSGCSAGGLASILHCDEFRELFPSSTKIKCLSDAGMFLDVMDVSGGHTMRSLFAGVVNLQGVTKNLPSYCTSQTDPTSCFFPQNLIPHIRTPLFILNTAYDSWQLQASLAPPSADPRAYWGACRANPENCDASQLGFLQGFRNQMLDAVKMFTMSGENGIFLNSCFAHCQTERQDTWYSDNPPLIGNKGIAKSVGDWYFDRREVKEIDCPYPCDTTCHNLIFKS